MKKEDYMKNHDRLKRKLGMNPSTAYRRLMKDILFKLAVATEHMCFHCKKALTRDTFSVEHKVAWGTAPDPAKAYFDLENIAFSHLSCNIENGSVPGSGR